MPIISKKGANLPTSPIRKLAKQANLAKERGIEVFHLNIGQPDLASPKSALNAIRNFSENVVAYGPSEGTASFRNKLVSYYQQHQIEIDAEDILVTTGASEAIIMALDCITNEGDELIIQSHFMPTMKHLLQPAVLRLWVSHHRLRVSFHYPILKPLKRQ
jgi:aspartate aminotransferase